MSIITLKENQSDAFNLITYPDGQHSIELSDKLNIKHPIVIVCRIKNFGELEVLLCLVTTLKRNGYILREIHFVYLFGMRSDRPFKPSQPNYFADVVAPIINGFDCEISFLFPHGNSTHYIKKFNADSSLANLSLKKIESELGYVIGIKNIPTSEKYFVIGGDESARMGQFMSFIKERKVDGIRVRLGAGEKQRLINFQDKYPNILIADDLCDGGGTFLAEAIYLGVNIPGVPETRKLSLFVAHGLFTQGIEMLSRHFQEIICTNSYQDISHPQIRQIKVI